jgi:hypothetical protein
MSAFLWVLAWMALIFSFAAAGMALSLWAATGFRWGTR